MIVKKLMLALLVLAGACTTRTVSNTPKPSASAGGATSPRAAATAFLTAIRQQDLPALGLVWGTEQGPANVTMDQSQLEMRGTVLMKFLRHDAAQVVEDNPAPGGQRFVRVELTCGSNRLQTTLTTVPTGDGRWFVQSVDLESVRNLCAGG